MFLKSAVIRALIDADNALRGGVCRMFRARVVEGLYAGNIAAACRDLHWSIGTIQKGREEVARGEPYIDYANAPGRRKSEEILPKLLDDIKDIVDSQSQTDPRFRTQRLYRRVSAPEVRRQLIEQKGYTDEVLPTNRTLQTKLNELGYHPSRVAKCKPKKNARDERNLRASEARA